MRDGAKKDNSKMDCTNILNDILSKFLKKEAVFDLFICSIVKQFCINNVSLKKNKPEEKKRTFYKNICKMTCLFLCLNN